MNRVVWLGMFAVVAIPAVGQMRGGGHGGVGARGAIGIGRGGFRVAPRPLEQFPHGVFRNGFNNFGSFGGILPFADYYDYGIGGPYDYGAQQAPYQAAPNVIVAQQPPPQQTIVQPAPPVQPEIIEYREPFQAPAVVRGAESRFVIAMKDGSRVAATAVWVQGDAVHYVDADDTYKQVPLKSVDRQVTLGINRQRNLSLWLPSAQ